MRTSPVVTEVMDDAGWLRLHLDKALEALTDEFNAGRAGPSGLRAQAIAHVRQAILILERQA